MKSTRTLNIFPASGGLNKIDNKVAIKFNELSDASNVVFKLNGNRRKRAGIENYVTDIGTPMGEFVMGFDYMGDGIVDLSNMRGMFDYWRVVSGIKTQRIVSFVNGKVYADNAEIKGIFSDITGSVVINPQDRVTFDVFAGALIMGFESAAPQYWTMSGNISPLPGSAPNGSLYRTYLGSGWIANVDNTPDVLYKSVDGNPLDWAGLSSDAIEINAGDRDPEGITALFPPMFGDLYVAKRNSIYRVRPGATDDAGFVIFSVSPIIQGVGCINHNTAVAVNNDIFFASEKGIHSLRSTQNYGDVDTTFLSYPIHNLYLDKVDFSRAKNMWAVYSPEYNAYILCYTKRGNKYNQDAFVYDVLGGRWSEWNDFDCAAVCNYVDNKKSSRLMFGGYSARIGTMNDNIRTDFGEEIPFTFSTGTIYPFGDINRSVMYKSITTHFVPKGDYVFDLAYQIDQNTSSTFSINQNFESGDLLDVNFILDSSKLDGVGEFKKIKKDIDGSGCGISISVSQSPGAGNDEDIEIVGYSIEVEDAEDTSLPVSN